MEQREEFVKDWPQLPDEKLKQYLLDWEPRGDHAIPYFPTPEMCSEIVDWMEMLHNIDDALGICAGMASFCLKPPYHIHNYPKLISAATGMDIDEAGLKKIVNRSRNLHRAFNNRRGMTRADEKPPEDHWKRRFPELEEQLLIYVLQIQGMEYGRYSYERKIGGIGSGLCCRRLRKERDLEKWPRLRRRSRKSRLMLISAMAAGHVRSSAPRFHAEPKYSSINPARARIQVTSHRLKDIWLPVFAGEYAPAECMGRDNILIDGKEYDECGFCRASCPSRDAFKEPDSGLPLKCDMCEGDPLEKPMCVQRCLNDVLTYEEREEEVEEEVKLEDIEVGLESMIDKYGLQKVTDTFSRLSMSKKG